MQFMNILSFDLRSPEIPICIIIQILQQQTLCGRFKRHNVFLIFFSEQKSVFECNYEPNSTEGPPPMWLALHNTHAKHYGF